MGQREQKIIAEVFPEGIPSEYQGLGEQALLKRAVSDGLVNVDDQTMQCLMEIVWFSNSEAERQKAAATLRAEMAKQPKGEVGVLTGDDLERFRDTLVETGQIASSDQAGQGLPPPAPTLV